jgi:hypothetical protein
MNARASERGRWVLSIQLNCHRFSLRIACSILLCGPAYDFTVSRQLWTASALGNFEDVQHEKA